MFIYARIKELRGKENENLKQVLKYIAENKNYMSGNEVQYKKMYKDFLVYKFNITAQNPIFEGRMIKISHTQYNQLRTNRGGYFSINTAVYLLTLYNVMLDIYKENSKKPNLTPYYENATYIEYVIDRLLNQIEIVINHEREIFNYIGRKDYEICSKIHMECMAVDEIANDEHKLYNEIW